MLEVFMLQSDYLKDVLDKAQCLYDKQAIDAAMDVMAKEMTDCLASLQPIFLCVVNGAIVPLGNFLLRLPFFLEVDYVHATRYRGQQSGGDLHWLAKPSCDLKDRVVVLFDDILDGGLTLAGIVDFCKAQGATKVYTAVMVDKKVSRVSGGLRQADFTGLAVEDHYVFGYGMDFEGYMRNVPAIYRIHDDHKSG
jgi:hypoxanthine phosphoribosyltransferase